MNIGILSTFSVITLFITISPNAMALKCKITGNCSDPCIQSFKSKTSGSCTIRCEKREDAKIEDDVDCIVTADCTQEFLNGLIQENASCMNEPCKIECKDKD